MNDIRTLKTGPKSNKRKSVYYDEVDKVPGCRDVVTFNHVAEAGISSEVPPKLMRDLVILLERLVLRPAPACQKL